MKVKVLKRFAIDGRLYEPGTECDLAEGIALRKQAQGELRRIIEKPPEPEPEAEPKATKKKAEKKKLKPAKEDKQLYPEDKADK